MDPLQTLDSLGVSWTMGRVSMRASPIHCRPSIQQFAVKHQLDLKQPLRLPLYFVSLEPEHGLKIEIAGWAIEETVAAAIKKFAGRQRAEGRPRLVPTPLQFPTPIMPPEDLQKARERRDEEIRQIFNGESDDARGKA